MHDHASYQRQNCAGTTAFLKFHRLLRVEKAYSSKTKADTRRHLVANVGKATWEKVLLWPQGGFLKPRADCRPGRLSRLKLTGALRLSLNDLRPRQDLICSVFMAHSHKKDGRFILKSRSGEGSQSC